MNISEYYSKAAESGSTTKGTGDQLMSVITNQFMCTDLYSSSQDLLVQLLVNFLDGF